MTFFDESDQNARKAAQTREEFPSAEERREFSRQWAQEELESTLNKIKETYRSGIPGISFSFDRTPVRGSKSSLDPRLDYEMGVAELVRLVEDAGVTCRIDAGNSYNKSGFGVSF